MSMQLAVGQELGIIPLSEHLIRRYGDGVREVEAPRILDHRDTHAVVAVFEQKALGQAARLLAEYEKSVVGIAYVCMAVEGFC